jgi:hypothetical protein
VTLTLSSGTFAGGGTTAAATAVNGVATFGNLVFNAPGSYTLAASDGGLAGATSNSFTVSAGTSVYDDFNTAATDFTANFAVHNNNGATSNPLAWGAGFGMQDQPGPAAGGGVQSSGSAAIDTTAVYTPSAVNLADGQVHTLSEYVTAVSGLGAGDKSLQLGYLAPTSTGFNAGFSFISARILGNNTVEFQYDNGTSPATSIDNTTPTGTITAGDWLDLIFTAQETGSGSFKGTFSLVDYGPSGVGPGTTVLAPVSWTISGLTTLGTASSVSPGFRTATPATFTGHVGFDNFAVDPPPPAKLAYLRQPSGGTAGAPLGPFVVAVEDIAGHTVSTDASTVTLTLSHGTFADGTTTVSAPAVNGVAKFNNLVINAAGSYVLRATDTNPNLDPGFAPFTINAASASKLAFVQQPSNANTGATISPAVTVAVEDAFGNTVTGDTSAVTLTLSSGTFAGGGNTATATAVNGIATFGSLVINAAGSYTLAASDGSLTGATSSSFTIQQTAAKLAFTQQPGNGAVGVALSPPVTVAVEDANGNTVTGDASAVTLTLSSGTFAGGGTTATAAAVNGIATFGSLVINAAGSYTLAASDGSLTGATSNSFTIAAVTSIFDDFNSGATSFTSNFKVYNNGGANNTSLAWGAGLGIQDQPGPAAGGGVQSSGGVAIDSTAVYTPSKVNLADGQVHTLSEYVTAVSGLGSGNKPLQLGFLSPTSTGFNAGFSFISARILGNDTVEFQYDNGTSPATSIDNTKPTGTITTGDWLDLIFTAQETASGSFKGTFSLVDFGPTGVGTGTTVLAPVSWSVSGLTTLGTASAVSPGFRTATPATFTGHVRFDNFADPSATNVLQYHNDLASTAENLNETTLTTSNVNYASFGKQLSTAADGQVYAQPLFESGVSIGGATHNVAFVATEHDSVYAVDADSGSILWQKNYLQTGERTLTTSDVGTTDITPQIGITGTPVIDATSGTLYFVTKATTAPSGTNASASNTVQRLHAVDLATGNEKLCGPVVISASVNGTGAGNDGAGHVPFDSLRENQRMGLILSGGVVYITWASHGDNRPYHGWVIGYNASTLQQTAVFNDTPNGSNGGIWESGGAVSVDSAGNFYLTTGNGTFETTLDANGMPNQHDFGDSVLKLALDPNSSPTSQNGNGWGLKVVDYFTPDNQASLNSSDTDLGSGDALHLPDSAGSTAHPHLLLVAGKAGEIYLIDRDAMGHFDPNANHVVQDLPGALNAQLGNPAYFNGDVYYATPGFGTDNAKEFSIANAALSTAPVSKSPDTFTWRGGTTSVSANGTSNGIVWALDGGSNQLRAYSAASLGTELYTSAQAANNRDQLGTVVKFTVPTLTNGHVYVGVSGAVVGYGLLPQGQAPAAPANAHPTLVTTTGVDLDWVNNDANATGVKVLRQQGTNPAVTVATLAKSVNSFFDTGLSPGTQYTYTVQAVNAAGSSSARSFTVTTPASASPGFSAHVNFSNNQTQVPAGYVNDTGAAYGAHGSLTYGWLANGTPTDNSVNARDRDSAISPDELHDSLIHLQKPNNPNAAWQIAVPNGTYQVHIPTGDPTAIDSVYSLNADGVNVVTATPNSLNLWADGTQTITVTNGLLTITSGALASNNKIDAIDILPVTPPTQVLALDAGGGAVGSFAADADFSGGSTRSTTDTITTSGAANPAPAAVYQNQRFGNFTYTLPSLTAGAAYTVRLHFAEFIQNGPGRRTFSVAINGTTVLSNFDVFQAAGGFERRSPKPSPPTPTAPARSPSSSPTATTTPSSTASRCCPTA